MGPDEKEATHQHDLQRNEVWTWYVKSQDSLYLFPNLVKSRGKTVMQRVHCIFTDANNTSLCFPLDLTIVLVHLCHGLWTYSTVGKTKQTKKKHSTVALLSTDYQSSKTRGGGGANLVILTKRRVQTKKSHISFHPPTFSPPHTFLHSLLLRMEQWVKSSLEQEETCCECATSHTQSAHRQQLTASSCELPIAIWQRACLSLLWPLSLLLLGCDLCQTTVTLATQSTFWLPVCGRVRVRAHTHLWKTANLCSNQQRDLKSVHTDYCSSSQQQTCPKKKIKPVTWRCATEEY